MATSTAVALLTAEEIQAHVREAVRAESGAAAAELPEVLTRTQAAALLQVDPVTVVQFVAEEGLPARKLGVEWRFMRSEVLKWFEGRKRETGARKRKPGRK